jgi:3-oxoacyl-[acyl-carrier protein] reductase
LFGSYKTVLITGAGKGIGLAIAKKYIAEGYNVICHYHSSRPLFDGATFIKGDFSTESGVEKFIQECTSLAIKVDVLINNAACFYIADRWEEIPMLKVDEVLQINFKAPLRLSQYFIGKMLINKWGRIVNISSISVEHGGNPASLAYTTSKAALESMTKTVSKKTARSGVLINAIRVGLTDTEFHKKNPKKLINARVNQIPIGRMATPKEIASVIYFYGSDLNTFTAGSIIKVAGGE